MAWLRRPRFRNHAPSSLPNNDLNIKIASSQSNPVKSKASSSASPWITNKSSKTTKSLKIGKNNSDTNKNVGRRRFSFFSKKSNDPSPPPPKAMTHKATTRERISDTTDAITISDEVSTAGTIDTADITTATDGSSSIYYMDMTPIALEKLSSAAEGNGTTKIHFRQTPDTNSPIHFREEQPTNTPTSNTTTTNSLKSIWKDDEYHLGKFITPRQGSDTSELTTMSKRSSSNSSYSPKLVEGEGTRASPSSGGSVTSSQSDDSDKNKTTLPAIFNLREPLCAIPDNSYHSTVTEELSRSSMHSSSLHGSSLHGNSKHGSSSMHGKNEGGGPATVNLNSIREDLETQLKLRTGPIEDDHVTESFTTPSPVSMKFAPKSRSFLSPIPKKNFLLQTTVESEPEGAPTTQSNTQSPAAPKLLTHNNGGSFHLSPITKDLSLESSFSCGSALPADLSFDMESPSLALETSTPQDEPESPHSFSQNVFKGISAPHKQTNNVKLTHLEPPIVLTDVSSDLDDSSSHEMYQEMYHEDDAIRRTFSFDIEDDVCPIYNTITTSRPSTPDSGTLTMSSTSSSEDEGHMIRSQLLNRPSSANSGSSSSESELPGLVIQRPNALKERSSTTGSSSSAGGCRTVSSGSSSEDEGHLIRSMMLDGNDFDSNCDSNSETVSEAYSSEKGSVTKSSPYRRLGDDNRMIEDDRSLSSTDSGYHFLDMPQQQQESQNVHIIPMDVDDEYSNSDSEVATASSDEDMAELELLCSDAFDEEERCGLLQTVSSSEEESDLSTGTLSMLGLFHDGQSYESSVLSFDSAKFFGEETCGDSLSKNCSISLHDITTIHEEDEDDIAEEESLSPQGDVGLPMESRIPTPLDGELRLPRRELVRQGTAGTAFSSGTGISSVTDDSYMCMSYDTLSLDSTCSYDSFSSESVTYMVDALKEETERKRTKIRERIAKIQESTDRLLNTNEYVTSEYMTSEYVASRLMGKDEDSTLS